MTAFDRAFSDQIDWATKEFLECNFNIFETEEGNFRLGVKGNQQIDIAIMVKVISNDRTKNSEFGNLPLLTKLGQGSRRNLQTLIDLWDRKESPIANLVYFSWEQGVQKSK